MKDDPPNHLGLTNVEAQRRLARYGANEPVPTRYWSALRELFGFVTNPLVLILLIASFASLLLGQHANALIVVAIVLVSIAINFAQTYWSHWRRSACGTKWPRSQQFSAMGFGGKSPTVKLCPEVLLGAELAEAAHGHVHVAAYQAHQL